MVRRQGDEAVGCRKRSFRIAGTLARLRQQHQGVGLARDDLQYLARLFGGHRGRVAKHAAGMTQRRFEIGRRRCGP